MDCQWMRRNLPAYLDGELGSLERWTAEVHLRACSDCFERYEAYERPRSAASQLPEPHAPANLNLSIRLAVMRERSRRGWPERLRRRLREAMREMMRPLAVRALGAAVSAVVLFGAVMPDLWSMRQLGPDVQLEYLVSSPTIVELAPYPVSSETTVLASVDSHGGIYDFQLPIEQRNDPKLRAEVANALLFTEVEPAMIFGRPVPGRVLISFTRYTVKG